MADPELVQYIRENIASYDLTAIKAQLIKDGVEPATIDAAIAEVSRSEQFPRSNLTTFALLGGVVLLNQHIAFLDDLAFLDQNFGHDSRPHERHLSILTGFGYGIHSLRLREDRQEKDAAHRQQP